MARPREYDDRVSTGLRLERDLHARLLAEAEDRDVSVNFLVTRAITDYLDGLPPVGDVVRTRDRSGTDG